MGKTGDSISDFALPTTGWDFGKNLAQSLLSARLSRQASEPVKSTRSPRLFLSLSLRLSLVHYICPHEIPDPPLVSPDIRLLQAGK